MALCPAHDDQNPSLSITPRDNNTSPLVHCFAGCTFAQILESVETRDTIPVITVKKREKTGKNLDARRWWEAYTCIDATEWESWGCRFTASEVIFWWEGIPAEKHRKSQSKEFAWTPTGVAAPPFWPLLPATLPERIYLIEGESDTGVFRHLGFDAYGMTKGLEGLKRSTAVWSGLYNRGAREVVLVLDLEDKSERVTTEYTRNARAAGLQTYVLRLNEIVDPLLGEKDPRDVWTRTRDPDLRERFQNAVVPTGGASKNWIDVMAFMRRPMDEAEWIVKDVLLHETVGMIVGAPKMGKTWLCLDLALSVALGSPFLGHFEVPRAGPVVYISKEDPDYLLQDRLAKVLTQKGQGGRIDGNQIIFPASTFIPLTLDLDREFLFTDADQLEALMDKLHVLKQRFGYLSLVIFDPILRMLTDADEFKASEMNRAIFTPSERIRRETGASVVLAHHKGKGTTSEKSSYGSIAFHAFSEGTQYLAGDEPDRDGWVHVRGEFKSAPETSWAYRFLDLENDYIPEVHLGAKPPTRRDVVRDLILLALKEGTNLSVRALAQQIEVSEGMVRDVLAELEETGDVARSSDVATNKRGGRPREIWSRTIDLGG
jgi:hypothetical protein